MIKNRICSIGGVASSELIRHIENNDEEKLRDHSKLKHCIQPEYIENLGSKRVLFLYGNPYNSIISIFNRNSKAKIRHEISMNFIKKWTKSPNEMNSSIKEHFTIFDFLNLEKDVFNIEEHIFNWLNYKSKKMNIILVKYEFLNEHIVECLNFLQCRKTFEIKKRNSDWEKESDFLKNKLEIVYGKIKKEIDSMPAIIKKINNKFL